MEINDIIIKPLSTEKMTQLGEKLNKYGFIVHKKANKLQIKKPSKNCIMLRWFQLILCFIEVRES